MTKFVRKDPIEFDIQGTRLCPEARAFAQWIDEQFAPILTDPSHERLDFVMLQVTKEYLYRRRGHRVHKGQTCLQDLFHEYMDGLWARQRSIPSRGGVGSLGIPALHLGDEG